MEENKNSDQHNDVQFMGFYSPVVDGTLIELLNSSKPGTPQHANLSKGSERFSALTSLERTCKDIENTRAENIILNAITDGKPFGLYLRNFALGFKNAPGKKDRYGVPQTLTVGSMHDDKMQQAISRDISQIPFVAISNPAFNSGVLPQLVLSNEQWLETVVDLIKNASIIVMFFLTATPGVTEEIAYLRAAGVQKRTLIVVASEDERNDTLGHNIRALFEESPEVGGYVPPINFEIFSSLLEDFPHVIGMDEFKTTEILIKCVDEIMKNLKPLQTEKALKIPPRPKPDPHTLKMLLNAALNEFDLGSRFVNEGNGEAAEDAFIRSIVYSYWSWDPFGRAVGFLNLGNVERYLLKYPNEAVACYFNSLNLFRSLVPFSPTAKSYYYGVVLGLSEYLKEKGDHARAQWVIENYPEIKDL